MLESNREIKKLTLYDIKKELTHPYADIRKSSQPTQSGMFPSSSLPLYVVHPPSDIFNWLTGETEQTLQVGMIVAARAFHHTERSVLCRLENGLMGFVNSENISDDREAAASSTIPIGMTVHARVLQIEK